MQGKMAVQILEVLDGLNVHDASKSPLFKRSRGATVTSTYSSILVLRKVLCHMLSKLYLDDIDQETLTTIINQARNLDDVRILMQDTRKGAMDPPSDAFYCF